MGRDIFSFFVLASLIKQSESISRINWPLMNGVVFSNLHLTYTKYKRFLRIFKSVFLKLLACSSINYGILAKSTDA